MNSKLFISFLTILTFGVSIYLYVTNFGMINSEYGSGEVILFAVPCTMMLVAIQLFTMPILMKHGDFFSRLKKGIDHIFVSLSVILFILHIGLLLLASGTEFNILRLLPILVGTVLITTANTLPRFQLTTTERTAPLENSTHQIWNATLRPFAYPLFWGGILMCLCVFLQGKFMLISFFSILVITLLTAASRAYKAYQLHLSE
ncbi:hypothetical protein [Bacillus sp. Marseille-Q1617]|uniref:hypothetical protein n=1 Tax=Bacillus sp. Marseille-Q1617 TaxID=2736887 RepID=UPI00158C168D|nr:hypothetical protein [Bacillus sp. Marseille-Q1617]